MNNYEEYEQWFEKNRDNFPLAQKWTREKFKRRQFEDRVTFYLESEWLDDSLINLVWGHVDMADLDEESEESEDCPEMSPEDCRADECQCQVSDLIDLCFDKGENSANTAALVYDLLKRLGFVQ